jgi:hypothetical protein
MADQNGLLILLYTASGPDRMAEVRTEVEAAHKSNNEVESCADK